MLEFSGGVVIVHIFGQFGESPGGEIGDDIIGVEAHIFVGGEAGDTVVIGGDGGNLLAEVDVGTMGTKPIDNGLGEGADATADVVGAPAGEVEGGAAVKGVRIVTGGLSGDKELGIDELAEHGVVLGEELADGAGEVGEGAEGAGADGAGEGE